MSNPNETQTELQKLIEQVGLELASERGREDRIIARGLVEQHRQASERWDHAAWTKDERLAERVGQDLNDMRRRMTREDMYKTQEIPKLIQAATEGWPEPEAQIVRTIAVRVMEWWRKRHPRKRLLEPVLTQAQIDWMPKGNRRLRGVGVIKVWRRTIE